MKLLVIATSAKPLNAEQEIFQRNRNQIDYLQLSSRLGSDYVDYDSPSVPKGPLRRLEQRLRLDFYWAWRLAAIIREKGYVAVLSMSERIGIPLSYALHPGIRHVVIMHHPMSPRKLRLMKLLRIPQHWDHTMTLSHAETDAFREALGPGSSNIETLHYAIDMEFYDSPNESTLEDEKAFILSIGVSQRDYPTLIGALRTLPSVTCHISATSAWVKSAGGQLNESMPENVRIVSYDHPSVIREAYAKCRFVVVPLRTRTTHWSAGSASVLQPQAMGKPVIATRTPGLPDYVRNGETGILVEGGEPAALAEAIDHLWSNPDSVAEMGQRAREWVRGHFSLDQWVDKVCDSLGN